MALITLNDLKVLWQNVSDWVKGTDAVSAPKVTVNNFPATQNVVVTGSNPSESTATIANAASISGAVDLAGKTLVGIIMPAAWTAANLTFQVSNDGVTYYDLYDNVGTEKNIIAAASRFIITTPADWVGVRYVKVRSGTAAAPVNQGASRAIILVTKAV